MDNNVMSFLCLSLWSHFVCVVVSTLVVKVISTFLAWNMRLKWLKNWQFAHNFANFAVENRLERFSMASLHYPNQVDGRNITFSFHLLSWSASENFWSDCFILSEDLCKYCILKSDKDKSSCFTTCKFE